MADAQTQEAGGPQNTSRRNAQKAGYEPATRVRPLVDGELTRRKPILKNRTPPDVEAIIVQLSLDRPAYGQIRIANELRKLGHSISPAGVRGVWQRHDLERRRRNGLEAKVGQESLVLAESQLAALEKAKSEKEAHGEFESECPGYCGAQDTFYVGNIKGVRRIYPQTFIEAAVLRAMISVKLSCAAVTAHPWFIVMLNERIRLYSFLDESN